MKLRGMFTSSSSSWYLMLLVLLLVMVGGFDAVEEVGFGQNSNKYSRDDFPANFIFGSGTAAYQVEGAANEDGRTPSIWDTFAHSGALPDKSNGDVASDEYHKYKEDVKLMRDMDLDAYRFSISWPRLIPNGRGPVNPKGLQYYNNLINELMSHGIQAHVTLVHYDIPQALEDEYGGWLSRKIVTDFTTYADVCFKEFGDRVSTWTPINEPNLFALEGYDEGRFPPQRCSQPFGIRNCTHGNSTTEPYIVVHNMLLAHASIARLYKKQYQAKQNGLIGFNIAGYGLVPLRNTTEDIAATQRVFDFYIGWFIDPLVFGDYPKTVKKNAGSKIPSFTPDESELVKGAFDFIGLNHYVAKRVKDNSESLKLRLRDVFGDMAAKIIANSDTFIPDEYPITPWALRQVLEYLKHVYGNPPIYIQENGQRTSSNTTLNDTARVKYFEGYIGGLLDALRNGSNTKGYFTWSFIDSFELYDGFQSRYGMYFVNFTDPNLERLPKLSAKWYSNFLKGGSSTKYSIVDLENGSSPRTKGSHLAQ